MSLDKIVFEVEQSENNSNDAKLFSDATNLKNSYSKDLEVLNDRIIVLKNQFSVTPEGKLAREMRRLSHQIKEEQQLQIFKLPAKMVHEVKSRFSTYFFSSFQDILPTSIF